MNEEVLKHHGILGQKWGVRRYQNEDGSLTALGKKRIGRSDSKNSNKPPSSSINTDPDNEKTGFIRSGSQASGTKNLQVPHGPLLYRNHYLVLVSLLTIILKCNRMIL